MKKKILIITALTITTFSLSLAEVKEPNYYKNENEKSLRNDLNLLMKAFPPVIKNQENLKKQVDKLNKKILNLDLKIENQTKNTKNLKKEIEKLKKQNISLISKINSDNKKIAQLITKQLMEYKKINMKIKQIEEELKNQKKTQIEKTKANLLLETTAKNLLVRQEPLKNSQLLGSLKKGTKVISTGIVKNDKNEIWFEINYKGLAGYVSGKYVKEFINNKPEQKKQTTSKIEEKSSSMETKTAKTPLPEIKKTAAETIKKDETSKKIQDEKLKALDIENY